MVKKTQVEEKLTADGLPEGSDQAHALLTQRDFLSNVAKASFNQAADARRKYDQEWLARTLFWRGYQFSRYLPQTNTVVLSSRQSAKIPINILASTMRAIRNQVTSFRPKWEVLPTNPAQDASKTQARYAQRLLDYYFDHLKLKMKIKETVTQALLYSVGGPWQIVYDPTTKEVAIWLLDPFDFYVDPLAESIDDAEYCIKAVRRPKGEVINNPQYSEFAKAEITSAESKIAASEFKQFLIQSMKNINPQPIDESSPVILYEGFFKKRSEVGKVSLQHVIWTAQNFTPLLFEELDQSDYDFVMYRGDLNPKEIYGESWSKHVIPLDRVLNELESSAFTYNTRIAKGRLVVDKDSGVRAIHNVHGEIISKARGSTVASLDMAPLPVAVPQQIERFWRYHEDVSGIHEASLGRVPAGVKTGIGIAELRQADATSQDDLVDNLEDFLTEVAMKLLRKIAQNYDSYKVIKDLGSREGKEKYFAVVGKGKKKSSVIPGHEHQVKIGPDWFDLTEIGEDNNIRVKVGSWLGYTKEALQQKVLSYYQLQLIDQKTALQLLEFGDIDSIVYQSRVEALLKKPADPNNPQAPDQMSLAMSENEMMIEGKEPPVSELDDHYVHVAVHQEALEQGQDEIVGTHIDKHIVYMGVGTSLTSSPASQTAPAPGMPANPETPAMPGQTSPGGSAMAGQQDITQPVNAQTFTQAVTPAAPAAQPIGAVVANSLGNGH